MKATKYTLTIKVEVLSRDSVPALVQDVMNNFQGEATSGNLHLDDGDEVTWKTETKEVEF